MKQKILDALKTKFEGVEEKILDKLAVKLAKTVTTDEGVKTAVDGVTFQDVLTSYGDSRANDAQTTAVKNYEKKYGIKDGKSIVDKTPPVDDPNEPEWFKAFRKANQEQLDALKQENEALKANKAKEERGKLISDKAKELGIPDYLLKHMTFADDADITTELTAFKQELVTNNLLPKDNGKPVVTTDSQIEADADAWLEGFTKNN